jgi:hypothetical protein
MLFLNEGGSEVNTVTERQPNQDTVKRIAQAEAGPQEKPLPSNHNDTELEI